MNNDRCCENCLSFGECRRSGTQPASSCDSFKEKDESSAGVKDGNPEDVIRTFETGATRDTVVDKLSYVKILSPAALRRFAQYMMKHAKQSDGSMREPDNWKKGFPVDSYLDSLGRHFLAIWLLHDGFSEKDNHGDVTLEDSLCGIVFNSLGWLHVLMEEKEKQCGKTM